MTEMEETAAVAVAEEFIEETEYSVTDHQIREQCPLFHILILLFVFEKEEEGITSP